MGPCSTLVILLLMAASTSKGNKTAPQASHFEGDIMLTYDQESVMEALANVRTSGTGSPQPAVITVMSRRWSDGIIPYVIDSATGLSSKAISVINEAIFDYENKTCVRFVPRSINDTDYIKFSYGSGCSSFLGRVGGEQVIYLGTGCYRKGVVIHEIFHALGRWHEHSRPDRDLSVTVHLDNVRPGYERNFEKATSFFSTTQGVPYDYDSVMHYSSHAFSTNDQATITPRDKSVKLSRLGQREGFSHNDVLHVKALYCPDGTGYWSSWSSWSSCSQTCNGGTQVRTRACVGSTNCMGQNMEERTCNTDSCPEPPQWSSWGAWSGCSSTCGTGRRTRVRTCVGGNACMGKTQEFEDCRLATCPEDPAWGSWGSWSACSRTCQGGYQYRTRRCINGSNRDCSSLGSSTENQLCNTDVTCRPREVEKWSECTKSCGQGVQFMRRSNGSIVWRQCNEQTCHNEPCLQGIAHKGCYVLASGSLVFLERTHQLLMDSPYNRTDPVTKCAQVSHLRGFTHFALALGLCYSGYNDLESYEEAGPSTLCRNGVGNYFGSFAIDVYAVSDAAALSDSVLKISECGRDYCMHLNETNIRDCVDDAVSSGSQSTVHLNGRYNLLLVIAPLLLALVLTLLLH